MKKINLKRIFWIASSKKDLRKCSKKVTSELGTGLRQAQQGQTCDYAKPLKGFGSAGVIEILSDDRSGTYRAVYTVNYPEVIFVLHVFQKKSKEGIKTPKRDLDLISDRLKEAEYRYRNDDYD